MFVKLYPRVEHDDGAKAGVEEEVAAENIGLHISCTLPLIAVSFHGSLVVSTHVFAISGG
jgi:hypothetical protein